MKNIPLTHLVDIGGLTPAFRRLMLREYAVNGAEHIVFSHNHCNALVAAENPLMTDEGIVSRSAAAVFPAVAATP